MKSHRTHFRFRSTIWIYRKLQRTDNSFRLGFQNDEQRRAENFSRTLRGKSVQIHRMCLHIRGTCPQNIYKSTECVYTSEGHVHKTSTNPLNVSTHPRDMSMKHLQIHRMCLHIRGTCPQNIYKSTECVYTSEGHVHKTSTNPLNVSTHPRDMSMKHLQIYWFPDPLEARSVLRLVPRPS